jgi:hypothetical protein
LSSDRVELENYKVRLLLIDIDNRLTFYVAERKKRKKMIKMLTTLSELKFDVDREMLQFDNVT